MSNYRNSNLATNPSLVWPQHRTQFDMNLQKKWGGFCGRQPVPTVAEGYANIGNYKEPMFPVPVWFPGNIGLELNDNNNPWSYTPYKM